MAIEASDSFFNAFKNISSFDLASQVKLINKSPLLVELLTWFKKDHKLIYESTMEINKYDEEGWKGQIESAGKSRQRVKGESPNIVKDSDQLWSPSHASATRKGAAKR